MIRRDMMSGMLGLVAGIALTSAGTAQTAVAVAAMIAPDHPLQASWTAWKASYLDVSGRVVDSFQQNSSHSEGQSYGLILSVAFGDEPTFRLIKTWSETNLAVRDDGLMAWRWQPDTLPHVVDRNNATDGDLVYAWALIRAARLFNAPELDAQAQRIVADLVAKCIVDHPDGSGRKLLLPAAAGFDTLTGYVLNPSYWMPRALRELASVFGSRALETCASDAVGFLDELAASGPVPDWIGVSDQGFVDPPVQFSANSGYEAMRTPLFLAWSNAVQSAAVRQFNAVHVAAARGDLDTPTIFARTTGEVLERSSHAGYRALPALVACALSQNPGAAIPPFTTDQPYYPATLHLMVLVMQIEGYQRCVPI